MKLHVPLTQCFARKEPQVKVWQNASCRHPTDADSIPAPGKGELLLNQVWPRHPAQMCYPMVRGRGRGEGGWQEETRNPAWGDEKEWELPSAASYWGMWWAFCGWFSGWGRVSSGRRQPCPVRGALPKRTKLFCWDYDEKITFLYNSFVGRFISDL